MFNIYKRKNKLKESELVKAHSEEYTFPCYEYGYKNLFNKKLGIKKHGIRFKTCLSFLVLLIAQLSYSQDKINVDFKSFYEVLKSNDLENVYKKFISTGEYEEIFKAGVMGALDMDSIKIKEPIYSIEHKKHLADSVIRLLYKQASDLGFKFDEAEFIDVYYTISKKPKNLFISLKGDIFLSFGSEYFKLPIIEAVLINNSWKISQLGELKYDSLYNSSKAFEEFSEYGTLKFEYKVVDVKLEVLQSMDPPPPPPPPPPPGKQTRRNKSPSPNKNEN